MRIAVLDRLWIVCYYSFMARDIKQIAHEITKDTTREKNPAAVALGRLGGLRGGKARAKKLSASQRSEIAKNAALKRWHNK